MYYHVVVYIYISTFCADIDLFFPKDLFSQGSALLALKEHHWVTLVKSPATKPKPVKFEIFLFGRDGNFPTCSAGSTFGCGNSHGFFHEINQFFIFWVGLGV